MHLTRREALTGLGSVLLGSALPRFADAAAKPKSVHAPPSAKAHAGDDIWADLMQGNKRFVDGKPTDRALVPTRAELAKGQKPKVMVLACSDSRVVPTLIFDKTLGDLFVVRTAGNVGDPVALGSLEY